MRIQNTTPTRFCYTQVESGKLRGYLYNGTYTFKGIPYASAQRFLPPEKPRPWQGIKSALVYGMVSPIGRNFTTSAAFTEYAGSDLVENERCQFLNIWTPSLERDAKKPVIFWLHGGGFAEGASNELASYDGTNISRFGDVVFVSINHRLNVLGFLDLSDFGPEYRYSGNVGMLDILMALEWVRDNIASFGGDPDNVTVVGQSGGAGKTWTLLGMPKARGLFRRVWCMSGRARGMEPERAREIGRNTVKNLGISPEHIAELSEVPFEALYAAAKKAGFNAMAVFDPELYPEQTVREDGTVSPVLLDVPIITSWTLGEMNSNLQKNLFEETREHEFCCDEQAVLEKLHERYGEHAAQVQAEFQKAYPGHDLRDALYLVKRDSYETRAISQLRSTPVYEAVFSWTLPLLGGCVSWHTGGDVAFLFHNAELMPYLIAGDEEGAEQFQHAAASALIAYARTGDPSTPENPWPAYKNDNGAVMVFDRESGVRYHHDADLNPLIPKPVMPDIAKMQALSGM